MTWFFLALGCAFLTSCCDAVSKRVMQGNDEWLTGTVLVGIASVILVPVFVSQELRPFSRELIVLLMVALPLEVFAYYLFLSAIRMAPLSLTVPLLAFTPVLTILTSGALLGETISLTGGVGIGLVTVGAYLLNVDLANRSVFAPLHALLSNPGSRRMFLVALIWSITSSLGKKGVIIYGAIPFGFVLVLGVFVSFGLVSLLRTGARATVVELDRTSAALFLLGGIIMAGAEITHFVSLSMAPVAYMISVKRLSLVFSVVLGWLIFRERNIRYRLIASMVMVTGVFFIYG